MKEMKIMIRAITGFFTACVLFCLSGLAISQRAYAASTSFSLYPSSGYAILNQDFAVDIMLDTGSRNTTTARAVLSFNPQQLRITKAEFGSLYCQYPDDEYSSDNTSGQIILTGFCLDPYYNSNSTPGLFGRVTFKPLIEGTAVINFVYSGSDVAGVSVIKDTGSPPINILTSRPSGGSYSVVTLVPSGTTPSQTRLPSVGLFDNKVLLIGGSLILSSVVLLCGTSIISAIKKANTHRDRRTVII